MSGESQELVTPSEYLELENRSGIRHEFYNGELFAMAGGTREHNRIVSKIGACLNEQFRNRPCEEFLLDMRVRVSQTGLYTYPNVVALCHPPEFDAEVPDSLLNPQLIVEVLSPSTESCDRGKKFEFYREIETLTEYLLVAQDHVAVEQFTRNPEGSWLMQPWNELADTVQIDALQCRLELSEIYRKVNFQG